MGRTVEQIQRYVASYVGMPTDPEVEGIVFSGIQDQIDELNAYNWAFQLRTSGLAFVAGDKTYSAPTDYKASRHFSYLDTNDLPAGKFESFDPKTFRLHQSRYINTEPQYYTVDVLGVSGVITLSAGPSDSFITNYPSGEITYYAKIQYPTSVDQDLNIPPDVEQWLLWSLRAQVSITFAENKSGYAQGKADRLFERIRTNNRDDAHEDF